MHTKFNTADRPPEQLELPGIEFAPPKVWAHGLREAHTYPLVSRGKRNSVHGAAFRVPASVAWAYPEIELRTGNSAPCIVLDLDGANALERCLWLVDHGKVREPNWMVTRRDGGGTHVVYTLERPVLTGPDMRAAPIRLLGRVAEYYSNVFEADPGYVGVLSHNPMARAHGRGFDTNWRRTEPYRLPELAEVIPFGWRIPKIPRTAEGRKTGLFLAVMQFAGKPEHAEHDLLAVTIATNQSNCPPLELSHVRSVAKSVTRYRARWIAEGAYYTPEQTTLWAQARQRRGVLNRRRRHGLDERDAAIIQAVERGESMRSVEARYGLAHGAVRYIVRRGVENLLHRWCPRNPRF